MALDLSALTVTEADVPGRAGGGGRKARESNPFRDILADSWVAQSEGRKAGKRLTVEGENVGEVISAIREASNYCGLGCRIVVEDAKGVRLDKAAESAVRTAKDPKLNARKFTVLFQAQPRAKRNPLSPEALESRRLKREANKQANVAT